MKKCFYLLLLLFCGMVLEAMDLFGGKLTDVYVNN